ncbi:alpha/beta hydrolase [Leucobacter allii]|uniref:Alpha/beta hydrolase n=1 Tax=Leucobacter allii TaxID=2932247 RepID=A0ABY4FHF2_9MICO|nr:lipase family protein [Leucobacter allii]UOQ56095.1 alpha/beta hydrolase [Leucobacter allii]
MTGTSTGAGATTGGRTGTRDPGGPLGILLALATLAAGAALVVAPLHARGIAAVTGVGLILLGIALVRRRDRRAGPRAAGAALARAAGALIALFGLVVALWPSAGAPWIAFLIGVAIVLHGALAIVQAFLPRGMRPEAAGEEPAGTDQRITAVIAGLAGIVFGALTFVWPVLTLTTFRYAVGVWLVFHGLRGLLAPLLARTSRRAHRRGTGFGAGTGNSGAAEPAHRRRLPRWARTVGAVAALAVAAAFAWGSGAVLGGAPLPQPGAFYAEPAQLPDEPGRLLRAEALSEGVPEGAEAWRILYTTTHPDGSPAVSSGTVLAPRERGDDPLPLLTVAHGTTGVVGKCAPSLSATPFVDGAGTAMAELVTEHGWVAVTSDYVGLGTSGTHPYLVGDAEARNVLDASRAVQRFSEIATTTETVVWGHSQGGQAALWTGQIAADYAPELEIRGVAAFAPAADLFGLAEADKDSAAGKTVSAYIASTWDRLYPELELEQQLTPGSQGGVERIRNLCFNGSDALGAILYGTQVPNQVFPDRLLDGAFGERLQAQAPTGPWPAPVFVAQGLADPLVRPAMQRDWVTGRCSAGEPIEFRTYPGLSHNTLVAADSPLTPEIVRWTLDRWQGKDAASNCDDLPDATAD